MESASPRTPLRRRNGRPQACEPCRKRKVACDHSLPICLRCKKRDSPQSCVYLAPATLNPVPRPVPRRLRDNSMSPNLDAGSPPPPEEPMRPQLSSNSAPAPTPGYLGVTSFSAVYQETEDSLTLARGVDGAETIAAGSESRAPGLAPRPDADEPAIPLSPKQLEQCITALRGIPHPELGEGLFSSIKKPVDGWMHSATIRAIRAMYATFWDSCLRAPPSARKGQQAPLEEMARLLSRNTRRPFPEDEEDPVKWVGSFSGQNFRWDALGTIFAYWACAVVSETVRRPEINSDVEGSGAVAPMRFYQACAKLCLDICHDVCKVKPNSLLLFLTHKHAVIETFATGDAGTLAFSHVGCCSIEPSGVPNVR
jgi:hypothetical protein